MKNLFFTFLLCLSVSFLSAQESVFELNPEQSMCITGKGAGQDAAINPFSDSNSIAVVKNLGKTPVDVRIQKKGTIIELITLNANETKEFMLLKGYVLYLDSEKKAKADVTFRAKK